MKERKGQGFGKARAIKSALARLGMQASAGQVVAALADFGSAMREELVRLVKLRMLKEDAQAGRQRVKVWSDNELLCRAGNRRSHCAPGIAGSLRSCVSDSHMAP